MRHGITESGIAGFIRCNLAAKLQQMFHNLKLTASGLA